MTRKPKLTLFLLITAFLAGQGMAFAVLTSDSLAKKESVSSPNASKGKASGKVTLKLKPKSNSSQKEDSSYFSSDKKSDDFFEEDKEYEMGISKTAHPAKTKPNATSPIKQTVSGPVMLDYSKGRPAQVLDRGKQSGSSGSATVTGTVRSN